MAKIVDIINQSDKTLFSFEILPPKKGDSMQNLIDNIEPLMEFGPKFIDVTYHREEFVYKRMGNGLLEKKATRKRPGTVGICSALMHRFDVETVPHILCGGFTKETTENALIDLQFLGINNVLALRGDPIKTESVFRPEENGNAHAVDLLDQIVNMNKGIYLDEEMGSFQPTDFCVGVAGYPEKHFESPNMKSDLKYVKMKVDHGADYVVTQMFFDNQKYFDFVERCRAEGINVPVIPGLKPLTSKKQIVDLPRLFHIDIPEELSDAVEKCKSNDEVKQVGIEWAVMQSRELMKFKAPCLHFYFMGKGQAVKEVAKQLF